MTAELRTVPIEERDTFLDPDRLRPARRQALQSALRWKLQHAGLRIWALVTVAVVDLVWLDLD